MTTIEIIDELHDSGKLQALINAGVISTSMVLWRKIHHSCNQRIDDGVKKSTAVAQVSEIFNVSESTVWRALKMLKTQTDG